LLQEVIQGFVRDADSFTEFADFVPSVKIAANLTPDLVTVFVHMHPSEADVVRVDLFERCIVLLALFAATWLWRSYIGSTAGISERLAAFLLRVSRTAQIISVVDLGSDFC
jgi:hypothetical protein